MTNETKKFTEKYEDLRNKPFRGWKSKVCNLHDDFLRWDPSQEEIDFIIEKGEGCGIGSWTTYADMDYKEVKDKQGNVLKLGRTRGMGDMIETLGSPKVSDICWDHDTNFTVDKEKEVIKRMKTSIETAEKFKKDLAQAVKSGKLKQFEFIGC